MVAIPGDDNHFSLGYSLCCKKDRFDKIFGKRLAKVRTEEKYQKRIDDSLIPGITNPSPIPNSIEAPLSMFALKMARYLNQYPPKWMSCVMGHATYNGIILKDESEEDNDRTEAKH